MSHATQQHRSLAIQTPLGKDALLLVGFSGQEEMSRLFSYDLEMLSERGSIAAEEIVGKNVTFCVARSAGPPRVFNGFVSKFSAGPVTRTRKYRRYQAEVVPWLWFLTRTTDCRIFQQKTVPEIIEQIFSDLGFRDYAMNLRGQYPQRTYCVQYRESDFNFVSRLMEDEGIFYRFDHQNDKHVLVLADSKSAYPWCEEKNVRYQHAESFHAHEERVGQWSRQYAFCSGRQAHTDYNFETPRVDLMSNVASVVDVPRNKGLELYDYPGEYEDPADGRRLAKIRMEEEEARYDVAQGKSSCRTLTPGTKFCLREHPDQAENGRGRLITSVRHYAVEPAEYETGPEHGRTEFDYYNEFTTVPESVVFRAQRLTRKPLVEGPQTAVVVGPPGEEIYPDQYGRVKVQFPWDREGKRDENSSCWIRVSQTHAGKNWGHMDLPRIGEEVIVDFLEGNPDRPIITGRVYNAENMPPFALPAGKTRRGNTTKTYLGGGYNEMSMDDTAGKEQIRVNAQSNMDTNVNNNQTLVVGVDRTAKIGNNDGLKVGNNSTESVGNNKSVTVGNNMNVNVGKRLVVNAGTSITLKCGASRIYMNAGGVITITGTIITTAAAANASVIAPLTEVVGGVMLTTIGGAVNMLQGAVVKVGALGLCSISGGKTDVVASGENQIKGATIKLN
jgi:type VI secretion system secreted protein VgrG